MFHYYIFEIEWGNINIFLKIKISYFSYLNYNILNKMYNNPIERVNYALFLFHQYALYIIIY